MQLNCLPGLRSGIASIIVVWPISCTFHMLTPLSPVFPHSLCLALGQRQCWMYYCLWISLVSVLVTLKGFLLLFRCIGIPVYLWITVMIPIVLLSCYCLVIPVGNGPYLLSLAYSISPYVGLAISRAIVHCILTK